MLPTLRTFQDFLAIFKSHIHQRPNLISRTDEQVQDKDVGIELPHALTEPHPALLGRRLGERGGPITEGNDDGEEQKKLHPDAGCLAFG